LHALDLKSVDRSKRIAVEYKPTTDPPGREKTGAVIGKASTLQLIGRANCPQQSQIHCGHKMYSHSKPQMDPASRREVEVAFNALETRVIAPKLTATCESSSQVIKHRFVIKDPNPVIAIDFGVLVVGGSACRTVQLS
jgi:hypothetical protein